MRIPYSPKLLEVDTYHQSEAYKKGVARRKARALRLSNYSNFVTDLTLYLETRYQCKYQDVYRSLGFVSLSINSKAINLDLSFKRKHTQTLKLVSVAFKESGVDAAQALFAFFLISGEKYGVEDYHVVRPTGIPESFFEARGFIVWNNGEAWKISQEELAEQLACISV